MSVTGTIIPQIYTARAQLPVQGATIAITQPSPDGRHTLLALRTTGESGKTPSIPLPTPGLSQSTAPEGNTPFAQYDLWVHALGFEVQHIQDVQVFPQTETIQKVELIPLPEDAPLRSRGERTEIPPQDL